MSASTAIALLGAIISQSPTVAGTAFDSSSAKTPPPGSAGNPLCGPLPFASLNWGPKRGPLHLSGTVLVGPGQVLELLAGTLVLAEAEPACQDSTHSGDGTMILVVGGSLRVKGLPGHPVVFQPSLQGNGFGWGGIRAESAAVGTVDLAWPEVRRARTGISFVAGSGEVRHGVVVDCGIGIAAISGAAPRILHSVVARSLLADAVSERSAPLFRSCLFLDGKGDGLRFQGTGLARVENSCFWNHGGITVVRGQAGLGRWTSDTLPDRYGNWRRDPLLRGSAGDLEATAIFSRKMAGLPWWKRTRMPREPPGAGPWALSGLSPLLGAGERGLCKLPEGTRCDIGLWSWF